MIFILVGNFHIADITRPVEEAHLQTTTNAPANNKKSHDEITVNSTSTSEATTMRESLLSTTNSISTDIMTSSYHTTKKSSTSHSISSGKNTDPDPIGEITTTSVAYTTATDLDDKFRPAGQSHSSLLTIIAISMSILFILIIVAAFVLYTKREKVIISIKLHIPKYYLTGKNFISISMGANEL